MTSVADLLLIYSVIRAECSWSLLQDRTILSETVYFSIDSHFIISLLSLPVAHLTGPTHQTRDDWDCNMLSQCEPSLCTLLQPVTHSVKIPIHPLPDIWPHWRPQLVTVTVIDNEILPSRQHGQFWLPCLLLQFRHDFLFLFVGCLSDFNHGDIRQVFQTTANITVTVVNGRSSLAEEAGNLISVYTCVYLMVVCWGSTLKHGKEWQSMASW